MKEAFIILSISIALVLMAIYVIATVNYAKQETMDYTKVLDEYAVGAAEMSDEEATFTIIETVWYEFDPEQDITAYELALCLKVLLDNANGAADLAMIAISNLPPEAKRHFVIHHQ